jgi:branched-chain amino acid aminotransferase
MSECYGECFILNGELASGETFRNCDVYEGDSVYEVLRMMSGVPLFFSDHMERLTYSVVNHGRHMLTSIDSIATDIMLLRKNAGVKEANLKIVFNYKNEGNKYLAYFIEATYPTHTQYREGVPVILFKAERVNPGVKVINHKLRSSICNQLISSNAYEALLVDNDGCITEGSRSNVFFVKGDILFTAPDEKVLGGITRKHVLDICFSNSIRVITECVNEARIAEFDAVFLTGTSPMVLAVNAIGDNSFKTDTPLIKKVTELYSERVKDSICSFRRPKV